MDWDSEKFHSRTPATYEDALPLINSVDGNPFGIGLEEDTRVTAKLDMVNDASDEWLVGGLAQSGEPFNFSLVTCSTEAVPLLCSVILFPFKKEHYNIY